MRRELKSLADEGDAERRDTILTVFGHRYNMENDIPVVSKAAYFIIELLQLLFFWNQKIFLFLFFMYIPKRLLRTIQ